MHCRSWKTLKPLQLSLHNLRQRIVNPLLSNPQIAVTCIDESPAFVDWACSRTLFPCSSPCKSLESLHLGLLPFDISVGMVPSLKMDSERKEVPIEKEEERKEQTKQDNEEENKSLTEKEIEDKIGPPPEKPLPGDCCGQGCEVCVWDTYWEELDQYKKLRKATEESKCNSFDNSLIQSQSTTRV